MSSRTLLSDSYPSNRTWNSITSEENSASTSENSNETSGRKLFLPHLFLIIAQLAYSGLVKCY